MRAVSVRRAGMLMLPRRDVDGLSYNRPAAVRTHTTSDVERRVPTFRMSQEIPSLLRKATYRPRYILASLKRSGHITTCDGQCRHTSFSAICIDVAVIFWRQINVSRFNRHA